MQELGDRAQLGAGQSLVRFPAHRPGDLARKRPNELCAGRRTAQELRTNQAGGEALGRDRHSPIRAGWEGGRPYRGL